MKVGHKVGGPAATPKGRNTGGTARGGRPRAAATARGGTARGGTARGGTVRGGRPREPRGLRPGPQTAPAPRPVERIARPKDTAQAKARAKARKAKAPTVKRPSLRERLILKLEGVDLRPRTLLARIPFVMLIIGAFQVFTSVYIMTQGGPANSTEVMASLIFHNAFEATGQTGYACALAWLMFGVVFVFVMIQMKVFRSRRIYD